MAAGANSRRGWITISPPVVVSGRRRLDLYVAGGWITGRAPLKRQAHDSLVAAGTYAHFGLKRSCY
jgi:hypothetical protein